MIDKVFAGGGTTVVEGRGKDCHTRKMFSSSLHKESSPPPLIMSFLLGGEAASANFHCEP